MCFFMESIQQINKAQVQLDLTEDGWKHIDKNDVESIINKKDKWSFWWFNDDKTFVVTLRNGKVDNYKVSESEILFPEIEDEVDHVKEDVKSDILFSLELDPTAEVKDTRDAFEKAKWSDKKVFWFYSKWTHRKAVVVLDFSKGKKPKVVSYPLVTTNVKKKVVKV